MEGVSNIVTSYNNIFEDIETNATSIANNKQNALKFVSDVEEAYGFKYTSTAESNAYAVFKDVCNLCIDAVNKFNDKKFKSWRRAPNENTDTTDDNDQVRRSGLMERRVQLAEGEDKNKALLEYFTLQKEILQMCMEKTSADKKTMRSEVSNVMQRLSSLYEKQEEEDIPAAVKEMFNSMKATAAPVVLADIQDDYKELNNKVDVENNSQNVTLENITSYKQRLSELQNKKVNILESYGEYIEEEMRSAIEEMDAKITKFIQPFESIPDALVGGVNEFELASQLERTEGLAYGLKQLVESESATTRRDQNDDTSSPLESDDFFSLFAAAATNIRRSNVATRKRLLSTQQLEAQSSPLTVDTVQWARQLAKPFGASDATGALLNKREWENTEEGKRLNEHLLSWYKSKRKDPMPDGMRIVSSFVEFAMNDTLLGDKV